MRSLGALDARSLATFRIAISVVILYDVSRCWMLADQWSGLQGYYAGLPLPSPLDTVPEGVFWRLAFGAYAVAAMALLVGYRTPASAFATWLGACGYQYSSPNTLDYHDAVVANLLMWCWLLPLGRFASIDARLGRDEQLRDAPATIAACGFVLTLTWMYLDTAARKSGGAWWDGSAVWLALNEYGVASGVGTWALVEIPSFCFRVASYATLVIEWMVPLLLLSPILRTQARRFACLMLLCLHGSMWICMEIGSFPPTMLAAAAALWPTGRGRWARVATGGSPASPWRKAAVLAPVLLTLANFEGTRLQARESLEPAYAWADYVASLKSAFALQLVWSMYAPEPPAHSGRWLAVALRRDGSEVDAVTGGPPALETAAVAGGLYSYYWSEPPYIDADSGAGVHHTYARYLLWRDARAAPDKRMVAFRLVYVYQPLSPFRKPTDGYPLAILSWPEISGRRQPLASASILATHTLFAADYDCLGMPGWQPLPLPAPDSY